LAHRERLRDRLFAQGLRLVRTELVEAAARVL
jgi:hypothetical protein